MRAVQRTLRAVVEDDGAARFLRHDPRSLARALELADADVAAMQSVDSLFESEKPIMDKPVARLAARSRGTASSAAFVAADVRASTLVVTADTGTLLPGPDTGTFSLTATAAPTTATTTAPRPPSAPAVPPELPRAPHAPTAPSLPVQPGAPASPVAPATPSVGPLPSARGSGCCASAAVTALVGNVSATAVTAITAITAIGQQSATDCRRHGQPPHHKE